MATTPSPSFLDPELDRAWGCGEQGRWERGWASGNQRVGMCERARERLVWSEEDRITVFPVLPHLMVMIN